MRRKHLQIGFMFKFLSQFPVNRRSNHDFTRGVPGVDGQKNIPTSTIGECSIILAICLGLPIVNSLWMMVHHDEYTIWRFTDARLIGLMIFELTSLCAAGFILQMKGWRYQDFGVRISVRQSGAGLLLFVVSYVTYVSLYLTVNSMPGMQNGLGRLPLSAEYSIGLAVFVSALNAFFEESVTAGYLLNAMRHHGVLFSVGLSTLVRLLYHTYQGPIAVISIIPMGILFGTVYCRWHALWPLILAHFLMDVLAFMSMEHLS